MIRIIFVDGTNLTICINETNSKSNIDTFYTNKYDDATTRNVKSQNPPHRSGVNRGNTGEAEKRNNRTKPTINITSKYSSIQLVRPRWQRKPNLK